MNPKLVPFEQAHLHAFDSDDVKSGPAFTALLDDVVLGCSGVTLLWPGVGLAWAMFTEELTTKWPIWTTRTVRNMLHMIINGHRLHRVEMAVLASNMSARKWAEVLGFAKECVAKQYTTDRQDVIRYVYLTNDLEVKHETRNDVIVTTGFMEGVEVGSMSMQVVKDHELAVGLGTTIKQPFRGRGFAVRLHRARLLAAGRLGVKYFVGHAAPDNKSMASILESCGGTKVFTKDGVDYFVTPLRDEINV